jgi:hypothetical protein
VATGRKARRQCGSPWPANPRDTARIYSRRRHCQLVLGFSRTLGDAARRQQPADQLRVILTVPRSKDRPPARPRTLLPRM